MSIRLMLVDGQRLLREALRAFFERSGFDLIAETEDAGAALALARASAPDVALIDVGLGGIGAIELTRRMRADCRSVRVLGLAARADRRTLLQMLEAGAHGCVVKSAGTEELLHAIRAVAAGQSYLFPEAAATLARSLHKRAPRKSQREALGQREREVLQLLADGKTSAQIAAALRIATGTVEVHRRNILRKLGLHNVVELTRYAIREGLVPL